MPRISFIVFLTIAFFSCTETQIEESLPRIEKISIFEIYFKTPEQVDQFSSLLKDTLQLPVEWEPFDFFGNGVVYDAAYHLGNTTLELLALFSGDSTMTEKARYNRILFHSNDISATANFLDHHALPYSPSFAFNIMSEKAQVTIGNQINLDSLSLISDVHIAFWEYLPAGFRFAERSVRSKSATDLKLKLDSLLQVNPAGIIGLKEIHVVLEEEGINQWHQLLGKSNNSKWGSADGLSISYSKSSQAKGIDWIKIRVKDLEAATSFLVKRNLLSQVNGQIYLDRSKVYGLKIILEE